MISLSKLGDFVALRLAPWSCGCDARLGWVPVGRGRCAGLGLRSWCVVVARVSVTRTVAGWRWIEMGEEEKRREWLAARDALDRLVADSAMVLVGDLREEEVPNEEERAMWLYLSGRAVLRG